MDDYSHFYSYDKILHSLESQLFKEKNFFSLIDQLHIQQNHVTVSGLKGSDYHSVSESIGGSVRVLKTSAIPIELQERTKDMKQNCMMGVFRDVDRIWLTVDSDLFIWNFENGSDLAYYDGCNETILAVELIKPKHGAFHSSIHYLLCIAGQLEILILGVSICGNKMNTFELVSEPFFRIATDNEHVTTIQSVNGRIILGTKSGNVLEISYWSEKPSWFKFGQSSVYSCQKFASEIDHKVCAKLINHSLWKLSLLLPNVIVNSLMLNEPIVQIAVDASRNMFYTRSDNSLIAQYELLPNDGLQRLGYITEDSFVSKASKNVKSVEKHQFRNIVELCPLGSGYGPLKLMAVTQSGVRLYFMENLQLSHIRMPPVTQSGMFGKMNNIRLCCESRGSLLMVCGTSIENQALYTISPDAFLLNELAETLTMSWTHGSAWFLAPLDKIDNKHSAVPVIQTQHLDPVRRFLMVSVDSIVQLELPSPIHHLREILEKNTSPQCPQIRSWINHYGPEETVYAALVIASDKKNSFLSSRATEVVLYYLNESIKNRAASVQQGGKIYEHVNPLHQALCMYAARILRPLWDNCIGEYYKPNGQDTYIVSTHDCEELSWFLHHLIHLSDFIRDNYPRLKSIDIMKIPAMSQQAPISLALELLELLKTTIEIVGLWRILSEHEFHQIIKLLSPEIQNELLRCTMKQLLLPNKRTLLVSLISGLLQHYLSDGASTDAIIEALLKTCPNIYRMEDALCSRANEILVNIDTLTNNSKSLNQDTIEQEKESLLIRAIELYEQVGPNIDLGSIICRLRAVGCTWGAVHLCLHAAKIRDPNDFAFNYLKEGHRPQNPIEISSIEARNDAYKYLLESLSSLLEASKYTSNPVTKSSSLSVLSKSQDIQDTSFLFPNNTGRNNALNDLNIILNTIFDRKDDIMAHFEVYSWMIDNGLTNEILKFNTIHLESYLQHRLQADPQNVAAKTLLWKHYELQNRLLEAAKVLDNLAVTECTNFNLDERLECISRAIVFVRAVIGGNQNVEIDYLKELEDKVEILHLQRVIIEEIGDHDGQVYIDLNSRLFSIYRLLTDYADQYDLTVSKLSILRVSGQNDITSIRLIWEELIQKEIDKLNLIDCLETRDVSLKQTIMQVVSKFKDCGTFLPMDIIISHLESYCDSCKFPADWTVSCFLAIDIPIVRIIQGYFEVLKMKDQDLKRHLNRIYNSLCICFDIFLHMQMNPRENQIYSSQFLDIIASCLIQLQSRSKSDSLVEKFRSYKLMLEQNI